MKRKALLLICLLLIVCTVFAACNKDKPSGDDNNTWPSVSYLTAAEKYTGDGEITHTSSFADGSNSVYLNNATEASVSTYRTQLENAGWTLAVGPVNNADNTAWGYTKGDATCTIRLYSAAQTEERSSGNYSFNLYIGFENDGLAPNPGGGDETNPGGDNNPTGVALSDFNYQLGDNYYISSRWDVTAYDDNDDEYVYQEYRKIALISGVYFIEAYDFNYEQSNVQGNYRQAFYIPEGADYSEYYRNDSSSAFDPNGIKPSNDFTVALGSKLIETGIVRAKSIITADTLQNITVGATSTHASTGRTVKKYTYGLTGTPIYDFYLDTQTKLCLKFDDYSNDGHINITTFSTSGNAWGSNGLPACPVAETPEPTVLSAPVVTINNSGLASWAAVSNATAYKIKINGGTEEFAVGLSQQLSDRDTIQVKAIGDGETYSDSVYSPIQTYTAQAEDPQPTVLAIPVVTINETGLASWAAVTNASGYKYKINDGAEQTAPASRQVQLTNGQAIAVKAVGNGTTYSDSVYSVSQTYTEAAASYTWPASAKLTEYGFSGLSQPAGSTISFVAETVATQDEPATLTIVISNGNGQMFDNLTTSLFALGATYGINEGTGTAREASVKDDLMNLAFSYGSAFMGLKESGTEDVYDAVTIEYYVNAGQDDGGTPIAAQTFIISFASIDLSSSSSSDPTLADYVTLPNKFTLTYSNTDGETRTIVKDGDKLWYHIESEYEDRENLAIRQFDGTYNTYEKDNKVGSGMWGTDPMIDTITYSNDVYSALEGFEAYLLSYAQRKVNGDVFETGASTTVAGMTCNVYTKESYGYTDTYYTYNGLTLKYTEQYEQDVPTVYLNVLTYSATGDLSGSNYSID